MRTLLKIGFLGLLWANVPVCGSRAFALSCMFQHLQVAALCDGSVCTRGGVDRTEMTGVQCAQIYRYLDLDDAGLQTVARILALAGKTEPGVYRLTLADRMCARYFFSAPQPVDHLAEQCVERGVVEIKRIEGESEATLATETAALADLARRSYFGFLSIFALYFGFWLLFGLLAFVSARKLQRYSRWLAIIVRTLPAIAIIFGMLMGAGGHWGAIMGWGSIGVLMLFIALIFFGGRGQLSRHNEGTALS